MSNIQSALHGCPSCPNHRLTHSGSHSLAHTHSLACSACRLAGGNCPVFSPGCGSYARVDRQGSRALGLPYLGPVTAQHSYDPTIPTTQNAYRATLQLFLPHDTRINITALAGAPREWILKTVAPGRGMTCHTALLRSFMGKSFTQTCLLGGARSRLRTQSRLPLLMLSTAAHCVRITDWHTLALTHLHSVH